MSRVKILEQGGALNATKAKEMLRDGTAHGKKLTAKQKRYFGYVAGGGTPKAENGLTVLDEDTTQFNGPSHADGGIPINYQGNKVEVEGGETAYKADDGSLAIMGNMTNPLTGRKFKQDSKMLAKNEQKNNKLMDYSTELVNKTDPFNKWDSLKFNAGKAMLIGTSMKKQSLSDSKEHLAEMQQAMLDISNNYGIDPQAFSNGMMKKAKNGMKIIGKAQYQSGGKWDFRGTNTTGLDPKISGFIDLLQQKGLTGFSGPESGVSQRNTKSGRASRHQTGEALDAFIQQPGAYDKILSDPELSGYLINNGLTAINEYNPDVASKTGATAGHLHIGYDKGTGISEQFRQDAATKYKGTNPNWNWSMRRSPNGKPVNNGQVGDAQYFPWTTDRMGDKPPQFTDESYNPQRIDAGPYSPVGPVPQHTQFTPPSNKKGLEFTQYLPELYAAATNKLEPVFAQKLQPELYEPYQVSFQDRRNRNTGTFRASLQSVSDNPEAVGALQAQKFQADNEVSADEFRTNQAIANDITNKNTNLINDANAKNLQLADTQFLRQSQAKSVTKATNQAIISSISSKIQQNKLENRTLGVYENLYPHYRYDENYGLQHVGPSDAEDLNTAGTAPSGTSNGQYRTKEVFDGKTGQLKQFQRVADNDLKKATDELRYQNLYQDSFQKIFNNRRVQGFPKRVNYPR